MQITGKVRIIEFDANSYIRDVRKNLLAIAQNATRVFVETAAPNVPMVTGMARGSFLNAIQYLRSKGLSVNANVPDQIQAFGLNGKPMIYVHTDGSKMYKSPFSAKKLSTRPKDILKWDGDTLKFTYATQVVHFNLNDETRRWFSFRKGMEAFRAQIAYDLSFSAVNPANYMLSTSYGIGKGGISKNQTSIKSQRYSKSIRNI